ncbi:preQ0 transporter, partial [Pseudomonas veronii]|nr:preQ0 transporter [Pseudomonas veronii]
MLFLIAYISSVVLINFAFSTAPHLDVIWSAWGGLVFILR